MKSYDSFSRVYDIFMENAPYDRWVEYLEKIWEGQGLKPKLIAELGCGTGNITQRLAEKGYDMIGIDLSEQMLMRARQKADEAGQKILYLNQDMREFELYGTVDSIICMCDSVNYILEEDELLEVFKLVDNYLDPNGLFIFDINTIHKFRDVLADNSFSETREDAAYTWENFYDEEENINEYYTNFFIKDEKTSLYQRFEEYHYERGYEVERIKELIQAAGMKLIGVYDEFTFSEPTEESTRVYFVAQEIKKCRS